MDQILRQAKLRPTVARLRVLDLLIRAPAGGLTSTDIVLAVQSQPSPLALGTVYHAIRELFKGGVLVRTWDGSGRSVYRVDDGRQAHGGLRLSCRSCGHTIELDDPDFDAALQRVMALHGAIAQESESFTSIPVICASCQQVASPSVPALELPGTASATRPRRH